VCVLKMTNLSKETTCAEEMKNKNPKKKIGEP
jgi:hypothetical protein